MAISAVANMGHAATETTADTTVNIVAGIGAPPYGDFGPDGKAVVSYEVDILKAIAEDAGLTLNFTVMDFDSMFPAVDSGRADIVSFGIIDRKSRQQKYDILNNAKDAAGIIAAPGLANEIKSIIDVCGHSLAASNGSSFVTFWDEQSIKCVAEGKEAINVLTFKNEAVGFN
ncbi:MAG: transporter substrate-binding domain-containing protein, partial [Roseovarius sp.]